MGVDRLLQQSTLLSVISALNKKVRLELVGQRARTTVSTKIIDIIMMYQLINRLLLFSPLLFFVLLPNLPAIMFISVS